LPPASAATNASQSTCRERSYSIAGIIECAKVDPASGCTAVIRGKDDQEVLQKAMEHAREHGIRQVTPELEAKVKAAIREEASRA
jgi:predicted small metal-binding protein